MLYENILNGITDRAKEIFGEELVGIYLHGSMAMGCFQPQKSDIDLLIVIRNNISDIQKAAFMDHVIEYNKIAPSKGIELSIVKQECCKHFLYPTPFELHFSNAHLQWYLDNPADYIRKMRGTDKDLAAHFTIIKAYGIVLYGAGINEVFADVPRNNYIDSIWADIEGAREEILENPVYIILDLCRVAAFLKDNLILSKKQGGDWGLQNVSPRFHALISEAKQCYISGEDMTADPEEAKAFADDMLPLIENLRANPH